MSVEADEKVDVQPVEPVEEASAEETETSEAEAGDAPAAAAPVAPKEPVMVPVRVVQEERHQRQAERDARIAAETELAMLKAQAQPQTPIGGREEKLLAEIGENLLTAVDYKNLAEAGRLDDEERQSAARRQTDDATAKERFDVAKEYGPKTFSEETAGKGLDYETVLLTGAKNLDPGDIYVIQHTRNPEQATRLVYQRSIERTPELSVRARQEANRREAQGGQKPPAGAGTKPVAPAKPLVSQETILRAPSPDAVLDLLLGSDRGQ